MKVALIHGTDRPSDFRRSILQVRSIDNENTVLTRLVVQAIEGCSTAGQKHKHGTGVRVRVRGSGSEYGGQGTGSELGYGGRGQSTGVGVRVRGSESGYGGQSQGMGVRVRVRVRVRVVNPHFVQIKYHPTKTETSLKLPQHLVLLPVDPATPHR